MKIEICVDCSKDFKSHFGRTICNTCYNKHDKALEEEEDRQDKFVIKKW
jgi:hypothetical protein